MGEWDLMGIRGGRRDLSSISERDDRMKGGKEEEKKTDGEKKEKEGKKMTKGQRVWVCYQVSGLPSAEGVRWEHCAEK